jgi:hypothetical protein
MTSGLRPPLFTANLHDVNAALGQDRGVTMFIKHLRNAEHTLRFSIEPTDSGWEVSEERDSQVVKRVEYHDWHRVERARRSIAITMDQLQDAGWHVE